MIPARRTCHFTVSTAGALRSPADTGRQTSRHALGRHYRAVAPANRTNTGHQEGQCRDGITLGLVVSRNDVGSEQVIGAGGETDARPLSRARPTKLKLPGEIAIFRPPRRKCGSDAARSWSAQYPDNLLPGDHLVGPPACDRLVTGCRASCRKVILARSGDVGARHLWLRVVRWIARWKFASNDGG